MSRRVDVDHRPVSKMPGHTTAVGTCSSHCSLQIDRVLWAITHLVAVLVVGAFVWVLFDIVRLGASQVSWEFLTTAPRRAGREGGIGTILISTLLVLLVTLGCSLPIGIGTAVWLIEMARPARWLARLIQGSLDLLASVPSIVFGLFGMVVFSQKLQLGSSILSGGLTLACMVLPVVIQATCMGLRSVPDELRRTAAALGLTRWCTLRSLLLPAALHGVVVGVVLGIGRAMAETAALIFTSGYVTRLPTSLLDSGRTLSVHIYDLAMNVTGGEPRACATALVLLVVLLGINLLASGLTQRWLRTR